MGRCVKIQKDTLLFTYAAVKCCSSKYQKTRKETGRGHGKEKPAKQPFIYNLKARPNQTNKLTY